MEIKMEESIKITLLGQQKTLSKGELQNLMPLFTPEKLKEIRFPTWMSQFEPESDVFHSCLYYVIIVENSMKHSRSIKFKEKCLVNITSYYVKRRMNFELYEYAYLCGKVLNVPLDRAMHIIYFLVYARLASKPYIFSIIMEKERKSRPQKKKTTKQSQKSYSIQSKEQDSRHVTMLCDPAQLETENLKKELRKIMNVQPIITKKMARKAQNKRFFKDEPNSRSQGGLRSSLSCRPTAASRVATIPVKVGSNENSSVISHLKLSSGNPRGDNEFKKIHVRRQKFNDWFDGGQKYQRLLHHNTAKENQKPLRGTSKLIIDKDAKNLFSSFYKIDKDPFEYFQDISNHIKNKNEHLDEIRYECSHHCRNTLSPTRETIYADRTILLNRESISSEVSRPPETHSKFHTNREVVKESMGESGLTSLLDKNGEKEDPSKMGKRTGEGKFLESYFGTITRKNEYVGTDDENMMLFNPKVKDKFKLQKYKQDYRHFLKSQMFERIQLAA